MRTVFLDELFSQYEPGFWESLEQITEVVRYDRTRDDQVVQHSRNADILVTCDVPITEDHLARLPNLKYICVCSTGYDHICIDAASQRGIPVSHAPGYSTSSVAQSAAALLLQLALCTAEHSDAVRSGRWSSIGRSTFTVTERHELHGKVMGIIGYGAIGKMTGEIACAMGMEILAHHTAKPYRGYVHGVQWTGLKGLLSKSDAVSLHCPLTPDTQGIISAETLAYMKPSAYLINTARGELINEEDLAQALHEGTIAGAGLDVLSQEPPESSNPLLCAPNCIITPHNAWNTAESRRRLQEICRTNIESFLEGEPVHLVN